MNIILFGTLLLFGYLCGSVPFGKLIGKHYGVDIQKRGSGNIGFANVLRVLGWRAGALTLAGDIAKGFTPTLLACILLGRPEAFWVGLVAIIGHLFPVWLKFHGGKGIATGLGVMLVLQPLAAVAGLAIYIIVFAIKRSSALGSLIGATAMAIVACLLRPADWWQYALLLAIALWTHRKNITGTLPNYDI